MPFLLPFFAASMRHECLRGVLFFLVCCAFVFADISPSVLQAQSLSIESLDAQNFPTLRAQVYAFDANGNRLSDAAGFTLTEDGVRRMVRVLSCPPLNPSPLSTVLTIDVSGSMGDRRGQAPNTYFPITLAKSAATAFVNLLQNDGSEIALTTFDTRAYIRSNFTTDRTFLQTTIETLVPLEGTNYGAGFAAALSVAAQGKNANKAIIFLTDGLSNANAVAIAQQAQALGVKIICITIGFPAPNVLRDIVAASPAGSRLYDNINSETEAIQIYRSLANQLRADAPCTIEWTSEISCNTASRAVALTHTQVPGVTARARYSPSSALSTQVRVTPNAVGFGAVPLRTTSAPQQITISYSNTALPPLNITRIVSTDPAFSVNLFNTPSSPNTAFTLRPGTPDSLQTLNIRYTAPDEGYRFTTFRVETANGCTFEFYATAGFRGSRPAANAEPLKLTHPNGGEVFLLGSDSVITWRGISPNDTVNLDYSLDAGRTWKNLTTRGVGLRYVWNKIPEIINQTTSNTCLMRVQQRNSSVSLFSNDSSIVLRLPNAVEVTGAQFDRTIFGNNVITTDAVGQLARWNGNTGAFIAMTSPQSPTRNNEASYSFDGASNIATCIGSNLQFLDSSLRAISDRIPGTSTSDPRAFRFNPLKPLQLVHTPGANDVVTGVNVYSFNTSPVIPLPLPNSRGNTRIADFVFPTKNAIFAAIDNSVKLWLFRDTVEFTGEAPLEWRAPDSRRVLYADARMVNGSTLLRVAVACAGGIQDRTSKIFFLKLENGVLVEDQLLRIPPISTNDAINTVAFDKSGNYLVATAADSIFVFDLANAAQPLQVVLKNTKGHGARVNTAFFSWDGDAQTPPSRVVSSSVDGTAIIWFIRQQLPLQQDQSDSLWAIVRPQPQAFSVDMKQVSVGTSKDSTALVLRNTERYPIPFRSIQILPRAGRTTTPFSFVSGTVDNFTLPANDSLRVEFRYSPTQAGRDTADLVFTLVTGERIIRQIIGEGIVLDLRAIVVDFGTQFINTTRDSTITAVIRNTGTTPVTLRNPRIFGIGNVFSFLGQVPMETTLAPNDTLPLRVAFRPTDIGNTTAPIIFTIAQTGQSTAATLIGTGIRDGALLEGLPALAAPASAVCDTTTFAVSLRNGGNRDLIIASTGASIRAASGAMNMGMSSTPNAFRIVSVPDRILAGSTGAILIRFAPQGLARGLANAVLVVTSNSMSGDALVNLSAEIQRDSLTFANFLAPRVLPNRWLAGNGIEPAQTGDTLRFTVRNVGNLARAWVNATGMSLAAGRIPSLEDATRFFQFASETVPSGGGTIPQALAPNTSLTLKVWFVGNGSGASNGLAGRTYTARLPFVSECPTQRVHDTISFSQTINSRPELRIVADSPPITTCGNTGQMSVRVTNIGTAPATRLQASIGAPFTVISVPDTLRPDSTVVVVVNYTLPLALTQGNMPPASGIFADTLRIAESSTASVRGALRVQREIVDFAIIPTSIDFPRLEANMSASTTITIVNRGSLPLDLASALARRTGDSAISFSPARPIPPNSSEQVTVRFSGGAGNLNFAASFPFFQEFTQQGTSYCSRRDTLQIRASTISRTGELSISDASANAGEQVQMFVFLRNRTNIPLDTTTIRDTLRLNATMLFPQGKTPRGRVEFGERVIPVEWKVRDNNENIPLDTLRFLVLAGNDSLTSIRASSSRQSRAPGILIDAQPFGRAVCRIPDSPFRLQGVPLAHFCLLGQKYTSGYGFITTSLGTLSIQRIYPQPISAEMNLEFWSKDAELTILRVFDARGQEYFPQKQIQAVQGMNTLAVPEMAVLRSGVYTVQLRNARELVVQRVIVVR